ncbi:sodium:dicarboxylate symporter [Burkholderia sp. WAC0059]|uniref:dicarboxylate/amino acid:cation symporter n=1 Tax=Burkholderia sp. WAC0059 TaxID=2066022 RepID=UPI000C7EAE62|nr:cation:dicarboxylase symporter family transporter [Burkholderia sp. WAC0059]PLZ00086.1 sodium:dicarboxylate symporter [Burkholderia sp. WAC0059]
MRWPKRFSHSTPALLLCMAAGGLAGTIAPPVGTAAYRVGQLYLVLVNMAAVPLLVVAMFFGLRQLLALPRPTLRVAMVLGFSLVAVALSGFGGALAGGLGGPGQHLPEVVRVQLGELVLGSGSGAGDMAIALFGDGKATTGGSFSLQELVPDSFFGALADGHALGILTGTILFGMAFSALSGEQVHMLNGIFESIYRALETIIEHANLLLPVLVFGTAAHLASHTDRATLDAMGGLLGGFGMLTLLLCTVAVVAISVRARAPFADVLSGLKTPMLVGLMSGSAVAPVPHTIEAMSTRLGFSRGVAELVVPFGMVFVRAGSALYFSMATVFVANLYDHPLGADDLLLIGGASMVAAFASAGRDGVATVGYAGIVLSALQLPVEAAVVLLAAVDPICDGLRNLLNLLAVCMAVAFVSAGLATERTVADTASLAASQTVLRFAFTRAQLALALGCMLTAATLIVLIGVGVGAR